MIRTDALPANAFDALAEGAAILAVEWFAAGRYPSIDEAVDAATDALAARLAAAGPRILDAAAACYDAR